MKEHTEKQPIDDLFARKLGNLSMKPSSDGFERLQARMGQSAPEARIVFWRNPVIQRSLAAAACLALVCLAGWQYWPSSPKIGEAQVAIIETSKAVDKNPNATKSETLDLATKKPTQDVVIAEQNLAVNNDQLAVTTKTKRSIETTQKNSQEQNVETTNKRSETTLAQVEPTSNQAKTTDNVVPDVATVQPVNSKQIATSETMVKSIPASERVLVVTIAEPEGLVASRQEKASPEAHSFDNDENADKGSKSGSLWKQVKRFKEGEIFARGDNRANEDRGLLSRAYSGLKHSIEKDKSTKQ
ncbi:hypothetical protein GCM10028807_06100 [Spirosoma daeguense]